MGRRTFESIGRPLPGRETIVLSRSGFRHPSVHVVRDLAGLDELVVRLGKPVWIAGGAEVYRQMLPLCDELLLTCVKGRPEGDTFFPPFEDQFLEIGVVLEQPDFVVRHFHHRRRLLA